MQKKTGLIVKTSAQVELDEIGAKYENDLPRILRPYFLFRMFIKFKKPFYKEEGHNRGKRNDTVHRYGYENNCTYRQCLNGHVENIILDRQQGFNECVTMAEYKFRDKFMLAQIFTRSVVPAGTFDILVREYNSKGDMVTDKNRKDLEGKEDLIKQITHPDNNGMLYFSVNTREMIMLSENPIPSKEEFHQSLTESLIN